jgi:hypothetical protein
MARFIREHPFFGATAAPTLLAADFFDTRALGFNKSFLPRLDFVQQKASGDKSIEALLAGALGFDLQTGRTMKEHHASRRFIDVLTAMAARTDEGLFKVALAQTEHGHALRQLRFFFGTDREPAHATHYNQFVWL